MNKVYICLLVLINAGRTIRLLAKVIVIPIDNNSPMLAIPKCEVNARLVKLHSVVNALKNTPRAELDCSKSV